jgi:hypothetical protein
MKPQQTTEDAVFSFRPVVAHGLWRLVSSRFHAPRVDYLRKMGFAEKKPLPNCTLEAFFEVNKHANDKAHAKDDDEYVKLLPSKDVADDRKYTCLNPDVCRVCFNTLVKVHSQGFEVCVDCGSLISNPAQVATCSSNFLGGTVGSSAGTRRLTTYIYKRTNHFIHHLNRVQAKQTSAVRPEIVATVENELRKERIFQGDRRITTSKVRSILKKLKLQKHYVFVFQITAKLSGKAPPTLTAWQEEKLLEMFQRIQEPFEKHCPPSRTNMLNYSYILRKFCQILSWEDLIGFFPLLKSRSKVYAQDLLWKKICTDTGFPFHKSIA